MTVVREIAVWKRRRGNNIKLDFATTVYVMTTTPTRYTHFRVQ
jgi:hypothetical protein